MPAVSYRTTQAKRTAASDLRHCATGADDVQRTVDFLVFSSYFR